MSTRSVPVTGLAVSCDNAVEALFAGFAELVLDSSVAFGPRIDSACCIAVRSAYRRVEFVAAPVVALLVPVGDDSPLTGVTVRRCVAVWVRWSGVTPGMA